jgi:hypothetical protein
MHRFICRTAALLLVAVLAAALPVTAQIIPAGEDRWVTPGDGRTFFKFPPGDVESLCGAPPSSAWDHTVRLTGVPDPGEDWDTVVARLDDADVSADTGGFATVPIQVTRLVFRSLAPQETPCGVLLWYVKAVDHQPITKMSIQNLSGRGGIFKATISVRVIFEATDSRGNVVGTLFYTLDLPDNTGVPWSFGPSGIFRPGIDEGDNCIDVLREKLGTATGDHVYYIENLIAQGKCSERN